MTGLSGLIVVFFANGLSTALQAQEVANAPVSSLVLQAAPGPEGAVQTPGSEPLQAQSAASLTGTVNDSIGTAVSGVGVTVVKQDNTVVLMTTTDSEGAFQFAGLSPGTYSIKIAAEGLEPFVSEPVTLSAGETRKLPIATMRIPTKNTTVQVTATLNQVAQAQVQEQEKQRVLGFLPNYYTSYIWNAAPMTRKLKFNLALRTTTDPVAFLVVGAVAGVEQAHKTFPGYGQGAEGYAKRYGATYADTLAGRMLGSAIFPVILHQDPRYFYQGSGSTRSRILYALKSTFVCRGDNGRLEPNYSRVLGSFAAAGLSNVYRASADRQAGLTFRNGLIILGGAAAENLLREFLSRKLTRNVPAFANGKP
ncbi:MAG TPA: carboxypeptidase-like regulatory domain-containing protein [Bryobacteraceae bacterium]|nr:carboxypeptidase-like regulatory domain-containing protein [Bryobacteraceae bacterium]